MDLGAILLALLTSLVVKVFVMILGARLVLKTYRATYEEPPRRLWILLPPAHLPEIKVLWWSLLLFFIAEFTCGIEVYILLRSHPLLTGAHATISGVGTALFGLGVFLYLDKEFLHFGEKGCLARRVCKRCTIGEAEGCNFLLVALLLATFVALAAVGPFFAPAERMEADMMKYMLPFPAVNAWFEATVKPWLQENIAGYDPTGVAFHIPRSMFIIEFRILPALVLAFAVIGIILMKRNRVVLGLQVTSFAFGMLAYVYLEVVLLAATGDVIIGSLGHEVAELWFVVITAEWLRRSFPPAATPETTAPPAC